MNEQNKHTSGPWEFTDEYSLEDFAIYSTGHGLVGLVYKQNTLGPEENNPEKGKANARLIAAAPELLEALEGIADICERSNDPDARTAENIAREAIAKAKGQVSL